MVETAEPVKTSQYDSRFRTMADVAPVMIWMSGKDALCNFFNQPWMDFTGRTMEQEMGNGWAEGVHKDDFQKCLDIYLASFKARTDFRMEYRLRRHDGNYRWILDTGRPMHDPSGEFTGFIGSCIDITDLKEEQEKNQRLRAQFYQAQKMEAIGSLAAGIAHDLKNLIIVVQGNADLIKTVSGTETKAYHYADQIFQAASREADMVKKLMLFSRKQPIQRIRLNYGDLSGEMMRLISKIIPAGVEIDLDSQSDLWDVMGDPTLLEQVFVNLVANARDAMPSGGKLSITFRNVTATKVNPGTGQSAVLGDCICMRVADTGIGMTIETLEHLFEPFYTTKSQEKGTGLGLASVYGIVKEHDGWVEVESVLGEGSAFSVYIPRAKEI